MLRGPADRLIRLEWKKDDAERKRSLPAGKYTIGSYRIARRDEAGTPWFISATAGHLRYRDIEVRKGEECRVEIDAAIRIRVVPPAKGKQSAGVQITGKSHRLGDREIPVGLSIYKDGKRIPIDFRLLDRDGKSIGSGTLAYGWGGGGQASWGPLDGDPARLELLLPEMPFEVRGEPSCAIGAAGRE